MYKGVSPSSKKDLIKFFSALSISGFPLGLDFVFLWQFSASKVHRHEIHVLPCRVGMWRAKGIHAAEKGEGNNPPSIQNGKKNTAIKGGIDAMVFGFF